MKQDIDISDKALDIIDNKLDEYDERIVALAFTESCDAVKDISYHKGILTGIGICIAIELITYLIVYRIISRLI